MDVKRQSDELALAAGDVVLLSRADVQDLEAWAPSTSRGRSRISTHQGLDDPLHEMIIVLERRTYVPPHKHPGKTESFHVISGEADVVLFDERGTVADIVAMGEYGSGRTFFYRLNAPRFHTVLVRSSRFVVHETTNGPFEPAGATVAPWAPAEDDSQACADFRRQVESAVARLVGESLPRP